MEKPEDTSASEPDGAPDEAPAPPPPTPPPAASGTGPYPQLLHHQLMTPRAPLPPGAGITVYTTSMYSKPPTVPATWAEDPHGRHQWRWWNGWHWTEHVADDGEASTDPLD